MLHALRWECKQLHNQTFAYVNDSSWLRFLALAVRLDGLSREMCSTARWIDSTWWYPQTDLPANEKTCCTVLLRCISVSSLVDCHTWVMTLVALEIGFKCHAFQGDSMVTPTASEITNFFRTHLDDTLMPYWFDATGHMYHREFCVGCRLLESACPWESWSTEH